ncbi:hypothetical protein [Corynebacterium cystitidis]|uniref:hypothetical protein n=1 Tax=Corynebacterium cystitidis TaxID=35757 RepID=UPI00211F4266|nr:hypothetical protein [Corynebacterium cystitidis]
MRRDFRSRIVGIFAVLIILTFAVMLLTTRQVMHSITTQEATADIAQEIDEFTTYAETAKDPDTGEPITDASRLFEVYLARQAPDSGEAIAAVVDGALVENSTAPRPLSAEGPLVTDVLASPDSSGGFDDQAHGEVMWGKVSITAGTDEATLIIARFLEEDRDVVASNLRLITLIAFGSILIAIIVAWIVAGRLINPVRQVGLEASDLSLIKPGSTLETTGHPDADALATTFNTMLARVDATDHAHRGVMRRTVHQLENASTAVDGRDDTLDALRTLQDLPVGRRVPSAAPSALDHLYTRVRTAVRDELGSQVVFSSQNIDDTEVEVTPDLVVAAARHAARSAQSRLPDKADNGAKQPIVSMHMGFVDGQLTVSATDSSSAIEAESLPAFFEWDPDPLAIDKLADQPHLSHAIMRVVADVHGGQAWVESEEDKGTSIGITIPAPLTYPEDADDEEES